MRVVYKDGTTKLAFSTNSKAFTEALKNIDKVERIEVRKSEMKRG